MIYSRCTFLDCYSAYARKWGSPGFRKTFDAKGILESKETPAATSFGTNVVRQRPLNSSPAFIRDIHIKAILSHSDMRQ
jgi:hypothetical protein